MNSNKINFVCTNIRDFNKKDTLYIKKTKNDFGTMYLCKFISFYKGVVTGKIIATERSWDKMRIGETITARLTNCYLWGSAIDDKRDCCHWFKKDGFAY